MPSYIYHTLRPTLRLIQHRYVRFSDIADGYISATSDLFSPGYPQKRLDSNRLGFVSPRSRSQKSVKNSDTGVGGGKPRGCAMGCPRFGNDDCGVNALFLGRPAFRASPLPAVFGCGLVRRGAAGAKQGLKQRPRLGRSGNAVERHHVSTISGDGE